MIRILFAEDKVIKLEEAPGGSQTWILDEDDDGKPVWTEIKNRCEKKEED